MAKGKNCLTRETFLATKQTTWALREVAKYLLEEQKFKYVLLGQLQSDPIEKRFGWYRQLSGGNYFVSVRQILEAEKSIRLKSLVEFSGFTMDDVRDIYAEAQLLGKEQIEDLGDTLLMMLDKDYIDLENVDVASQNILFYIAGYAAKSISKSLKCQDCVTLLRQDKDVPKITFDSEESSGLKQAFLQKVDRGGLFYPSETVYSTCLVSWRLYDDIRQSKDASDLLFDHPSAQAIFLHSLMALQVESPLNLVTCSTGHSFRRLFERVAAKMFNIFSKNVCAEVNSSIHASKKRKHGQTERKVKKLQSEGK